MAGTITFGGIGSGIDVEGIIDGLVKASRGPISGLQSRAASTRAAATSINEISSLLSKLKASAGALAEVRDTKTYSVKSSSEAVVATASGLAAPGSFDVKVEALAKEQRSYSDSFGSATTALGQSGTLELAVGAGSPVSIAVDAGDSLSSIADKINSAGLRLSASLFFDGSEYRLQLRGLDTGAANGLSISEGGGVALGLSKADNVVQAASDARAVIDGFTVTSATNQISGAIQGVTLALTATTTDPVTVKVDADPNALRTKLEAVVNDYNAVVKAIHGAAGFGSVKATNPVLAGDSTLRTVTNRLSSAVMNGVDGGGKYTTLGSVGVSLTRDGLLSLDSAKLDKALGEDPSAVSAVLAGVSGDDGAMDVLKALTSSMTDSVDGLLTSRNKALNDRAKSIDERINREDERLQRYADQLRRQFQAMDETVSASNANLSYFMNFGTK